MRKYTDSAPNTAIYSFEPHFFSYKRDISKNMVNPHFHENYELYYLLSGRRRYIIENEIYDIAPGDIILIPKFKAHIIVNTPDMEAEEFHECFLLSPKEKDFPAFFRQCFHTHYYRLPSSARNIILECFHSLRVNQKKNDDFTEYCNHADLIKILSTLARLPLSEKSTKAFTKNDLIMQDAALYIKENCDRPLTLSSVADRFNFSKEYFSAIFKSSVNSGFNEYLTQMRITKAIELLLNTRYSIMEISHLCGFNDSNYFTTVFKKTTGFSPRNFRSTHSQL